MANTDAIQSTRRPFTLLTLFRNLAIFASIGIGISVWLGLREMLASEGGLAAWVIPTALAAVLSAAMVGLWHAVLGYGARTDPYNSEKFWSVLALGLVLTTAQAATSMAFLTSAIGGQEVVQHHRNQHLNALEQAANQIATAASGASTLQSALGSETQNLLGLLADELIGNGPSGVAGDGPMAGLIRGGIAALTQAQQGTESRSGATDNVLEEARAQIASAREANALDEESAFFDAATAAARGLTEAASSLSRQGELTLNFAASDVAQLRALQDRLTRIAGAIPGQIRVTLPDYTPISRARAALTYADVIPLAWSTAIAIDALPLIMLVVLLFAKRIKREEE